MYKRAKVSAWRGVWGLLGFSNDKHGSASFGVMFLLLFHSSFLRLLFHYLVIIPYHFLAAIFSAAFLHTLLAIGFSFACLLCGLHEREDNKSLKLSSFLFPFRRDGWISSTEEGRERVLTLLRARF
ncbi:hypothetical protein B0H65DRAFT_455627 [Neurospora tetraspora]|uniref:Transmembrane protein n=1 Tax=Neurospora tetraspora TaxID=94610 RepID=A0AAE0JJA7_9PEZI|nr:hypothetical protein B0H65DRAFT_455627 [Neurospora tetraspora]